MDIEIIMGKAGEVALVDGEGILLSTAQDALDLIADIHYQYSCNRTILNQQSISPDFFDLKTGLAGEILQKFTNYRMGLGIVGEFASYNSKSLLDFIYECNKGSHVFFAANEQEAVKWMENV